MAALTQERLRTLFDYHEDGHFVRLVAVNQYNIGSPVYGTPFGRGYRCVRVDGELHLLHRLIFLWHHGWLPDEVDHDDRDRGNCRIGNLLPSTRPQNALNRGTDRRNRSGFLGVHWHRGHGKFTADVTRAGARRCLGYFNTAAEAARAIEEFDANGHD